MNLKKLLLINRNTNAYKKNKESKGTRNKNKNIKVDHVTPRTVNSANEIILTKHLDLTTVACFKDKEQNNICYNNEKNYSYTSHDQEVLNRVISPSFDTQYLPFGDGSDKVFGYENFGNTCYCNSILQCLFYLDSFRVNILSFPLQVTNNHGTMNVIKRHRKRRMEGMKKRYFTVESFQPIVKEKGKLSNQATKQLKCVESGKSTKIVKSRSVKNNINDNIIDCKQTKTSSLNIFSRHKRNKSLSPGTTNNKDSKDKLVDKDLDINSSLTDIGPTHSTVLTADYITERLHEGCERIIVGRNNCLTIISPESSPILTSSLSSVQSVSQSLPISSVLQDSDTEKTLNPNQDILLKNDNDIARPNFFVNSFTSEKRKKSALIDGPILNIDYMVNVSAKPNIYNGLKDIFECITENDRLTGIVSPSQFMRLLKKENILFRTSSQQDAHEILNFILNDIDDYLKTIDHEENSNYIPSNFVNFIKDQFQGLITSTTKCLTCDTNTSNIEPFLDFPIELLNEDDNIDIQDLFREYKQSEFLRGPNKFYCNQCNSLQEAERSVTIGMLPPILIFHLKRFEYSEQLDTNVKLFNKIVYPLVLDVSSNRNSENRVYKRYELASVVIHMGVSPRHGHYISLCKSSLYGWLLFDDETVESVRESTVLKFIGDKNDQAAAYVLFYKEVSRNCSPPEDENYLGVKSKGNVEELVSISDISLQSRDIYEKRIENLIKKDDYIKNLQEKEYERLNKRNDLS